MEILIILSGLLAEGAIVFAVVTLLLAAGNYNMLKQSRVQKAFSGKSISKRGKWGCPARITKSFSGTSAYLWVSRSYEDEVEELKR